MNLTTLNRLGEMNKKKKNQLKSESQKVILPTNRARIAFFSALENDSDKQNPALKAAFKRHKKLVQGIQNVD